MQDDDEMLLRSLQDLVPDDLMNAELCNLDQYCLDSSLLPSAGQSRPADGGTFQPGDFACGIVHIAPLLRTPNSANHLLVARPVSEHAETLRFAPLANTTTYLCICDFPKALFFLCHKQTYSILHAMQVPCRARTEQVCISSSMAGSSQILD